MRLASTPATRADGRPTPFGYGWLAEFAEKGHFADVWYLASFGLFKGYRVMVKIIPSRNFTLVAVTNSGEIPWDLVELALESYAGP